MPTTIRKSGPDKENPEWTGTRIAQAMRFNDLPIDLQKALAPRKRGPQKAPTKKLVSLRLSPEVVDGFRATGTNWQTRIDEVLRAWVRRHPKAAK